MPPRPTVSLVIPAYNEAKTIRSCVEAAIAQTEPAEEIIVVNNRSTDRTADVLRGLQAEYPDAPLRVLRQDAEQGLVPTRNLGLDEARGEVIGRIDADSVLEPDWVEEVRRVFSDPEVAAATGPVIYYDMPLRRFGHRADDRIRRGILRLVRDYHFLFGSNMAIRASAWRDIRAVTCRDEADEFHEDIDLSIHLSERGHRVVYAQGMVAGVSARRLDDHPRDFLDYVRRFDRSYDAHGVTSASLRAPMAVFIAIYPYMKGVRLIQERRNNEVVRAPRERPEDVDRPVG